MSATISTEFQMWVTFAIIAGTLISYMLEKWPMEMTSLATICVILVFFNFFPVTGDGRLHGHLDPGRILDGFSNPALITVLALLVMGHGIIRTGVLDQAAQWFLNGSGSGMPSWLAFLAVFVIVAAVSGFLNNTPVVVIFIPIMQAMAARYGVSPSRDMMPLSFAAILGGMTTLIGSSTNLLVNTALIEMGRPALGFFDFSIPGLFLASVGIFYVVLVVPRILPDRAGMTDKVLPSGAGKQFILQIKAEPGSELIGERAPAGYFSALPDMTVRMIQRGEEALLPPFEDVEVRIGDVIVVAAQRKALKAALADHGELFHPDIHQRTELRGDEQDAPWRHGDQALAEVMVAPASRLIGQTLRLAGFRYKTDCVVLGIQRRARMIRAQITDIRLEAGDVLLVQGRPEDVHALHANRDVILIESSKEDLPNLQHAKRASVIFIGAVFLAATGMMPIVVAALGGAVAMVAAGVLNLRQAFRSIDPKIATAIAAALAMSVSLRETGGADFIAMALVEGMAGWGPVAMLSVMFLIAAVMTNIISNNAVAVLFTPIAVDLAERIGVPPEAFAVAIVFAANCSFVTPIGYQTNLLVMGPGHYKFIDFVKAGLPLLILIWLAFTFFGPMYYGFG